ncbi:MAG: ABC transporter ATP-binding protein [Ardenticatenales bacterium]|nr:ABC transporter ATP-binding protein [Ardenticatenales bacterium]
MVVNVEGVSFTYPRSDRPALDGIDVSIAPGEIFGFLGPSGAGKSTTQRILIGLLQGYTGDVRVFGRPPKAWGADYYERIGVSFEFPNHFLKLTARENLHAFAALYGGPTRDPDALLAAVALADDADVRVAQYSKGMKARLSVARSLLHNPELLFWDEPTAGLDPVNARRMKDLARAEQAAGQTIFLTTHDMMLADALCDRVALLVDGRIAALDTPRALKLRHGRRVVRVEGEDEAGDATAADFPLDGLADDAAFHAALRRGHVRAIHSQEATLEDVFLATTGRSLA